MKESKNTFDTLLQNKLKSLPPYQREYYDRITRGRITFSDEGLGVPAAGSLNVEATVEDLDETTRQRMTRRFERNLERAALWHVVHALTPEIRRDPVTPMLLPDEQKKGPASAQALIQYARESGTGIRPLSRLTALALRLTRQKTLEEVKENLVNITEMGHSN